MAYLIATRGKRRCETGRGRGGKRKIGSHFRRKSPSHWRRVQCYVTPGTWRSTRPNINQPSAQTLLSSLLFHPPPRRASAPDIDGEKRVSAMREFDFVFLPRIGGTLRLIKVWAAGNNFYPFAMRFASALVRKNYLPLRIYWGETGILCSLYM